MTKIPKQKLIMINDFISDVQMEGLDGYFYNTLPDTKKIEILLSALEKYELINLHSILKEAYELFKGHEVLLNTNGYWEDATKIIDPNNKLEELYDKFLNPDNYANLPQPELYDMKDIKRKIKAELMTEYTEKEAHDQLKTASFDVLYDYVLVTYDNGNSDKFYFRTVPVLVHESKLKEFDKKRKIDE